jgi:hypothetical protein
MRQVVSKQQATVEHVTNQQLLNRVLFFKNFTTKLSMGAPYMNSRNTEQPRMLLQNSICHKLTSFLSSKYKQIFKCSCSKNSTLKCHDFNLEFLFLQCFSTPLMCGCPMRMETRTNHQSDFSKESPLVPFSAKKCLWVKGDQTMGPFK